MKKCQITAENMYNLDEKRFMIGVEQAIKHILTRKKLSSGIIIGVALWNGNRKWVSFLAAIYAIANVFAPALIYQV